LLWKASLTFRVDMITFFGTLIRIFSHAFRSKRNILSERALLKKEDDLLLQRVGKKRVHCSIYDKLFFVVLTRADDIRVTYFAYNLVSVRTGVEVLNMNGIMERFFEDSEKRGAGQCSADRQESASADSG
jgi:hypothetical protein